MIEPLMDLSTLLGVACGRSSSLRRAVKSRVMLTLAFKLIGSLDAVT